MTSRRTREEIQDNKRRVLKHGIKRPGILPSFGDIVLPIVSVAAVCLLLLAGRQFFINGMTSSPEVKSTRAYSEAPALIAERKQEEKFLPPVAQAETQKVFTQPKFEGNEENLPAVSDTFAQAKTAKDVKTTKAQAQPVKASQPVKKAEPKTTTQKVTPAPVKTKAESLPKNKQWRVQVGAYGSRAAAREEANKIKAAGYNAEVYSNPASKHVKVWVYSGGDQSTALRVVETMKKMGYKTSFAFPPAAK